jgi:hypothetical protein
MSEKDGAGVCYEWQKGNTQCGQWARKFEKELERRGLGFIWHYLSGRNKKEICKMIKIRCTNIQ